MIVFRVTLRSMGMYINKTLRGNGRTLISAFCFLVCSSVSAETALTLDLLIKKALISYPTVLSRQASKEAAESDLLAAKLKFLPSPSFNTQRNQVDFDGGVSTGRMPATNISINQPLFLDGGIIAGYSKANAKLSAADFALLEERENISRNVVTAYAQWLSAWLKIQALEDSVRLHEKLAGLVSRRYEQGVASRIDYDLGVSRLHLTRADLDSQRSIEQTLLTNLSELIGEPVARNQLMVKLAKPVSLPNRMEGIYKAQANSASVQRSKFEADAIEQEAKEIRAQALPQLSFQVQRQIGNAYYPGAQGFNAYGLVLSYAPGGGLSTVASASAAVGRARAAALQVETVKRELTEKLNSEYNEYEFSLLKKENFQRSAGLTGEIADSYDRQYLVGRKSWLDLMNSVRENAQTRMQLAETEAAIIGASQRLNIYIDGTQQFDN